jgi:hypothetical protein
MPTRAIAPSTFRRTTCSPPVRAKVKVTVKARGAVKAKGKDVVKAKARGRDKGKATVKARVPVYPNQWHTIG